jgi:hypothetical protein
MDYTAQRCAVWCGPIFILTFFMALLISGFIPPSPPTATADTIAAMYRDNTTSIRTGMALQIIAAGFQIMFSAVILMQMLRIGRPAKMFALAQFGAGAAGIVLFIYPPLFWSVAAYRPERAPELTLILHDIGWMTFIVPFILGFFQCICVGLGMLADNRPQPVFPRWVGYFCIWAAIALIPGVVAMYFKSGPFAWNGLIVFWLPATIFGVWYIVMTSMLLKAIGAAQRAGE